MMDFLIQDLQEQREDAQKSIELLTQLATQQIEKLFAVDAALAMKPAEQPQPCADDDHADGSMYANSSPVPHQNPPKSRAANTLLFNRKARRTILDY